MTTTTSVLSTPSTTTTTTLEAFKDAMSGGSSTTNNSLQSLKLLTPPPPQQQQLLEKPKSQTRNTIAFLLFGLFNNVIFVYFMSGAADILSKTPSVPKSSILLASILPSLIIKCLTATLFKPSDNNLGVLSEFFYAAIIGSCSMVNILSLLLVSLVTGQFTAQLITQRQLGILFSGIVMSSIACGMGEGCFLALTSRYTPRTDVIVGWSSGTGVAGIVGALSYFLLTRALGWSTSKTFLFASLFPILMIVSYAFILTPQHCCTYGFDDGNGVGDSVGVGDSASVSDDSVSGGKGKTKSEITTISIRDESSTITLRDTLMVLLPTHILPLFMTYFSEYMINQSVYFSLWYGNTNNRENYYTLYQALYSCGVFLSRSFSRVLFASLYMNDSLSSRRRSSRCTDNFNDDDATTIVDTCPPRTKKALKEKTKRFAYFSWTIATIQFTLLIIFSAITMDIRIQQYIPSLSWAAGARSSPTAIFVLVFFEGLLGGSAYVNTFCSLANVVNERDLEFTMAFTSTSDTLGITIASLLSMAYQPFLCSNNALCSSVMN